MTLFWKVAYFCTSIPVTLLLVVMNYLLVTRIFDGALTFVCSPIVSRLKERGLVESWESQVISLSVSLWLTWLSSVIFVAILVAVKMKGKAKANDFQGLARNASILLWPVPVTYLWVLGVTSFKSFGYSLPW